MTPALHAAAGSRGRRRPLLDFARDGGAEPPAAYVSNQTMSDTDTSPNATFEDIVHQVAEVIQKEANVRAVFGEP
jgi:hypothetical protein